MSDRAFEAIFDAWRKLDGSYADFGHAEAVIERIPKAIDDGERAVRKIAASADAILDLAAEDFFTDVVTDDLPGSQSRFEI